MKVNETKSQAHQLGNEEKIIQTRKQKAEGKRTQSEQSPKKPKTEDENGQENKNSTEAIKEEFAKFCKAVSENLTVQQMREILQANGQDAGGSDDAVVPKCQDVLFFGLVDECPVCNWPLKVVEMQYTCTGAYSEWSSCTYSTKDPPRKDEPLKLPDSVKDTACAELLKKHQDPKTRPKKKMSVTDNPKTLDGMTISLSGRLSRKHKYWKSKIEKHGGKLATSIAGATCLVVSPAERDRGGSMKLAEAMEKSIPVVGEAWLLDSIEKQEAQPLDAYDVVSDLTAAGAGIPMDKQDPSEEAFETVIAELKIYGKRGVHKDTKLQDQGGQILESDGILYNCALSVSDRGRGLNDLCVMQLIAIPDNRRLYMYYKKGRIGDEARVEERLDNWENMDDAIKEFTKIFEELTGNEFEPWEREKKIQKKIHKFFPIDMDDGVEVRHGGLGLRQLGVAAAHSKLQPEVAKLMKILCSQEIYRYAIMEMGLDTIDIPIGMVTDFHLKRCEDVILEFVEKLMSKKESGEKKAAMWSDFSQRWFTLVPSTRPVIFQDFTDVGDNVAAAYETVRDITVASHLIGDMTDSTLDDPLSNLYGKLGCSITLLEKDADDFKMISNYLEKTYEPMDIGEVGYGISIENIFTVESSACPSFDEIKKLPNKFLLWCGCRTSNLLRHLKKGFLPAVCSLPVAGYMFGKAIVCSDAATEAARYGFTAVDRPDGFLVLAVASLGDKITELTSPPEDIQSLEEKKTGVKGLGRKKTNESEHFIWQDDIHVPCGRIIPSEHKDSALEYNEYAVYDPKQVSIKFLVAVKYEEKNVEYDAAG